VSRHKLRSTSHDAAEMPRSRSSPRYLRLRALLAEAREAKGLTQVELASRLGRPQSYVSKYEAGDRRLDVVEFMEVANAIGCDPHVVLRALAAVQG
jgi:transcriptional regulator with XRE-family HTH domain